MYVQVHRTARTIYSSHIITTTVNIPYLVLGREDTAAELGEHGAVGRLPQLQLRLCNE